MDFGQNDEVVRIGITTGPQKQPEATTTKPPPVAFGQQDTVVETATADTAAGSSFGAEMGLTTSQAAAPDVEPDPTPPKKVTNFDTLTNKDNLKIIRDYAEARFGDSGKQQKGESDTDYVKRWMTSMRQVEWNTTLNAVPELNWIFNAKPEDALKAGKAHQLYETIPDFWEQGGQPGVRPFLEATLSSVSEPTNLLSFGIGAAARYKAARTAINQAIKTKIKAVAGATAAEATVGAGSSAISQQLGIKAGQTVDMDTLQRGMDNVKARYEKGEVSADQYAYAQELYKEKKAEIEGRKVSVKQAAVSGLVSSVFGGLEARAAFKTPKVSTKQDLENVLADRKTAMPADKTTKDLSDAFDAELQKENSAFDIFQGRKTIDQLSPQTPLIQGEIRKDINTRAINVAKYILLNDETFSETAKRVGKKQQKVSDAVNEVFSSLDTIDEGVLDTAIQKSGLTLKEFADVTRTSVADAAGIMQSYSALARVLRNQVEVDPEAKEIIDRMYGRGVQLPDFLQKIWDGIQRLERESKALVVSSIGTTARNVLGTTAGLTVDAAAKLLDSTVYQFGKVAKSAATGKYEKGDLGRGLQTVVRDAFGTLTYLTNAGITAEVVDKLLVDNPRIKEQLFSALQESGNQNLSKVSKMANTFNVAQDALFRRAIFTASVERQLRGVGMDMYKLIADEKAVPPDVLKNAADEALKATFSYMPKQGVTHHFVKFWEKFPGGSLLVTFPRFMTNAMAFQLKHSPVGALYGGTDFVSAAVAAKKGDSALAERLYKQGLEKTSKGLVGTAALAAAYEYRLANQDSEWYNIVNEDGSTTDVRAIFPIAPYLAMADFMAKAKLNNTSGQKINEYIQSIIGIKVPAGSQGYLIDQFAKAFQNTEGKEAERFDKALGTLFGDFASRFIQPGQPIFQFMDQFRVESQVARDPNLVEGDSLTSEAALNRIKSRVTGLKEELPEAKRYLRKETPVRAGEFFNTLVGTRVVPRANDLEREFTRLGLDPYTFFKSTGDRKLDRLVIDEAAPFIEKMSGSLLTAERYKSMTDLQKRLAMSTNTSEAVSFGRSIAQAKMTAKERDRMDKLTFNNLSADRRAAINELYAKDNKGVTMDEAKDYKRVYEYDAKITQFR
jgi:hypothetical protein